MSEKLNVLYVHDENDDRLPTTDLHRFRIEEQKGKLARVAQKLNCKYTIATVQGLTHEQIAQSDVLLASFREDSPLLFSLFAEIGAARTTRPADTQLKHVRLFSEEGKDTPELDLPQLKGIGVGYNRSQDFEEAVYQLLAPPRIAPPPAIGVEPQSVEEQMVPDRPSQDLH